MKNKNGFVLSTYVYMLLVFFLLLLGTMLVVLNNTKLLSNKLKEGTQQSSGLIDKDFSFVLLGDKEVNWPVGETFKDPGFVTKTVKGVDLSDYVIIESNVNEDVLGNYTITYTITYNGKTYNVVRNVSVRNLVDLEVDLAEGEDNVNYETKYFEGTKVRLTEPTREGYLFKGWIVTGTGASVTENTLTMGTSATTVKAIWKDIVVVDNLKSYIETLAANTATANTHGLVTIDHTVGGTKTIPSGEASNTSIRYAGANPQNYVGFGACTEAEIAADPTDCELWRIIGIVDGKVKLVKKDSLGAMAYDSTDNIWITTEATTVKADINSYLNDGGEGQYTLPTGLANLVEVSTWYLGGRTTADVSHNDMYIYERGDNVYKKDNRKVAVTENTKVGLMYPSDYGYATKSAECTVTMRNYHTQTACTTNNWIYQDKGGSAFQWLMSPNSGNSNHAFRVNLSGHVDYYYVTSAYQVSPSVYLNSNVLKIGGSGTSGSPYTLGLSS